MKIHHLTADEALQSLQSTPQGLSSAEAKHRLLECGLNRVEKGQRASLCLKFLQGFSHFFALILWVAAALAFWAELHDPGAGMATLGVAILGVILMNGLFSFWQEYRAEQAIAALQKLLPHQVKALRDGTLTQLPANALVPGDVILLEEGDDVPADCRLLEAFGVRVNNATITGESLPQACEARPSEAAELLESQNILLAGTSVVSGQARAVVFATGMHTEFGKIAHLTQTADAIVSPLQQEIIRLSRMVALLATLLGGVFFCLGQTLGLSFWENFLFAIGIIVANVPEGLLPTVTLALAMGSQRMARRHALIRHLPAVETLGSATVICTDKTGTLTENRMAVHTLFLAGQFYDPPALSRHADLQEAYRPFFEGACLCHNLKATDRAGKTELLGDPMEVALVQMAHSMVPEPVTFPRLDEVPFDTERKRLSTLHQTPRGKTLYTKGALEMLLPLCQAVQMGTAMQPLTAEDKAQFLHAQDCMAEAGLRVLAFGYRILPEASDRLRLEEDVILLGLVGLEDPPRPEVPAAIRQCQAAGIKVIMMTGDHPQTARAIAREIGLVHSHTPVLITGEQLKRLSDPQLQLLLDAPEVIFARLGADQKLRIVNALRRKKAIVAVTGDGVNDAPALKQADIGIAMGLTGTDVAREAADMILLDDNFASIVQAIEEGRAVFANIRKFLTYILTSNIPEIVPYLAFVLFKIPLPLTIIQILAVDLGTDMLPALALGTEAPEPGVMQQPPRSPQERLWRWPLVVRAYLFLGVLEATAAMAAFFSVLSGGGWQYGDTLGRHNPLYVQATTACLSAIIVMQVVNVFLCRSDRGSVFAFGLRNNPLLLWGIALELLLILVIDYTAWGNGLFGTAPLPTQLWLFVVPFALGMLVLEEGRKGLVRFWQRGPGRGQT
jgi:calcium-translocating P-type ATPase